MGRSRIRSRGRRGAAILEGAFVLSVFFMMLLGIIDFGRLVWIYGTVSASTREASRWAMVHGANATPVATPDSVANVAKSWATGLEPELIHVTTVWNPDKKSGSTVRVTMQYDFSPVVGSFVGLSAMPLQSASEVIITQ